MEKVVYQGDIDRMRFLKDVRFMDRVKPLKQLFSQAIASCRQHPFPLLLRVEWFLIGLNLLELCYSWLLPSFFDNWYVFKALFVEIPVIAIPAFTLCFFTVLGFFVPYQKARWQKIAYTFAELGLLNLSSLALDGFWNYSLSFIVVVIRSCVIFELPGRLFTVTLTLLMSLSTEALFLSFLPKLYTAMPLMTEPDTLGFTEDFTEADIHALADIHAFLIQDSLGRLLYFGVVLIFVLLLTNALNAEQRSRKRLAIAHEQLRQYALRIENQATLEERNRIAREIHDSLGHLLTAQKIQLNNALAFVPEDPVLIKGRNFIEQGKQLGAEALQELRRSLNMLRSDPLAIEPLESLLGQLIARFNHDTALPINHQIQISLPISDQAKRATYRIVEEALTNIYKHSGPDGVTVTVSVQCTNPGEKQPFDSALDRAFETALSLADNEKIAIAQNLWIMIADDGQGFEMSQNTSGFGLRGMRERASNLGGRLFIESQQGAGCKVLAWFPLEVR